MKNWMIYEKIQEMKRNKLNKSQVCRRLGIDYKTVLKYWDMPPDDFAKARSDSETRKKKADKYKDFVLDALKKYPDMTAAQIYDWIKEQTGLSNLGVKERAFRNYIVSIRKEYDIKKPENSRQYEAVNDPPWENSVRWTWEKSFSRQLRETIRKYMLLEWFYLTQGINSFTGLTIHGILSIL